MRANFIKVNPCGNTTVFILDPFPRRVYSRVASHVMRSTSLAAEQVGFVERPNLPGAISRLHMMGGEFCGNASRGFAAWLAECHFPGIISHKGSKTFKIPLEVSGHNGVLTAIVSPDTLIEHRYRVEMSVPVPLWMKQKSIGGKDLLFTLVGFEGIVHAIVWNLPAQEDLFHLIKAEVKKEIEKVNSFGVMFYEEKTQSLTPVVYVRDVESMVWESSCGSGTVAVASALAEREKKSIKSLKISQPGGVIEVSVRWEANVLEAETNGDVIIEAEGIVYFDL